MLVNQIIIESTEESTSKIMSPILHAFDNVGVPNASFDMGKGGIVTIYTQNPNLPEVNILVRFNWKDRNSALYSLPVKLNHNIIDSDMDFGSDIDGLAEFIADQI